MLPNTLDFVQDEILEAFQQGVDDLMIVNCSNVKPHTLHLSYLASLWQANPIDFLNQYVGNYHETQDGKIVTQLAKAYDNYGKMTVHFGEHCDEHAGEQFMNYSVRILMDQWWRGSQDAARGMLWAHKGPTLEDQIDWLRDVSQKSYTKIIPYLSELQTLSKELSKFDQFQLEQSLIVQVLVYKYCIEGVLAFTNGFKNQKNARTAFYDIGCSAKAFDKANQVLRESEKGKWQGFYANECLCDIKFTSNRLTCFMAYIRMLEDGPYYNTWQRDLTYDEMDRQIALLTNTENYISDQEVWELMEKMAKRG